MTVSAITTKAEQALAEQFATLLPQLRGDAGDKDRRKSAFATFQTTGLPHRRIEAWHYTDWRNMTKAALPPIVDASNAAIAYASAIPDLLAGVSSIGTLSVNGAVTATATQPEGVELLSIAGAIAGNHPLTRHIGTVLPDSVDPLVALNSAMFTDGFVRRIGKGVKLAEPIQSICIIGTDAPAALNKRSVIVVEEGAEVTIVGGSTSPNGIETQISYVIEVIVGDNAKVEYITCNGLGDATQSFVAIGVTMGRNAEFNALHFCAGGSNSRHQVHVAMQGEGSKLGVRGVGLLNGTQHADATLVVDHIAPNCESRELFRNVIDDEATGVFQGKIIVKQAAQKTDGRMASNAVLLSDGATMNNKPELEIFADDVQCAHGATCGALDEDLLFYLQARGLPKKDAEALMLQAFVGEVLENVSNEAVRDRLNEIVERWLKARGNA